MYRSSFLDRLVRRLRANRRPHPPASPTRELMPQPADDAAPHRLPAPDPTPLLPLVRRFAAPGFSFGTWQGGETRDGVMQMSFFALSPDGEAFVTAAYQGHWVRPEIDWSGWASGPAYKSLRGDANALAGASTDKIAHLLITLIRGDRCNEGMLATAFD